jgi:hypothetical protein
LVSQKMAHGDTELAAIAGMPPPPPVDISGGALWSGGGHDEIADCSRFFSAKSAPPALNLKQLEPRDSNEEPGPAGRTPLL